VRCANPCTHDTFTRSMQPGVTQGSQGPWRNLQTARCNPADTSFSAGDVSGLAAEERGGELADRKRLISSCRSGRSNHRSSVAVRAKEGGRAALHTQMPEVGTCKRAGGGDGDGLVAESKGVHFFVAVVRFQDICAIRH